MATSEPAGKRWGGVGATGAGGAATNRQRRGCLVAWPKMDDKMFGQSIYGGGWVVGRSRRYILCWSSSSSWSWSRSRWLGQGSGVERSAGCSCQVQTWVRLENCQCGNQFHQFSQLFPVRGACQWEQRIKSTKWHQIDSALKFKWLTQQWLEAKRRLMRRIIAAIT